MADHPLRATIAALWERRDSLNAGTRGADRDAVEQALALLESGEYRVAEPRAGACSTASRSVPRVPAFRESRRCHSAAIVARSG